MEAGQDGQPSAVALCEELDACLAAAPHGLGERDVEGLLDATRQSAAALIRAGAPDEALPLARSGEALATLTGDKEHTVRFRLLLAEAEGPGDGAIAWCCSAVSLATGHNGLSFDALTGLGNAYTRMRRWPEAAAALASATAVADAAQRPAYVWPTAMQAARLHLVAGEPAPAREFLELALANRARADGVSVSDATADDLALTLAALAEELRDDNPRAAADVAGQAVALSPGLPEAQRVRAYALSGLDDHPNAVTAYRSWLAADPGNGFAWNNLAHSLVEIGEDAAALDALAHAVAAAPEDLRFRLNHAGRLAAAGHFDDAATELDEVVRIGEQLVPRPATELPVTPVERGDSGAAPSPSVTDQIQMVLVARGANNLRRGRLDLAGADAERLLASADPVAKGAGHALRAELRERRGDLVGALTDYERADALSDLSLDSQARLLIRLGRNEAALDVLERLASRDKDPETARAILDDMVERLPGSARPLAVRGLAHFESGYLFRARADLRAAVAAGHDTWRTYLLLGLSCVQIDPHEDPSQDLELLAGFEALGEAALREPRPAGVRADQSEDGRSGEATQVLTWLLDRMLGSSDFLGWVGAAVAADPIPRWLSAVPLLPPVLTDYLTAVEHIEREEWQEAARTWERTQIAFEAAGFPVSAARTSLSIADALLRLHDLDAVAAHLDRAADMTDLINQPLTPELRWPPHPLDRVAHLEFEYLYFYGIGTEANENWSRGLRITLAARSGEVQAAAAEIGDGAWLFSEREGRTVIAPGLAVTAVTTMAQILRDAGQRDRATELLTTVARTGDGATHTGVYATLSTLVLHDFAEATRYLDLAVDHADEGRIPVLRMMRAQLCLHHRRWDEALALLDAAGETAQSTEYGLAFAQLRSRAYLGRGEPDRAADLAVQLVNQAEESRLNLTRWQLRMAWSGTAVPLYETAIEACVAAGRFGLAFDLAERARSRAFLDEDALTDPEVDALTTALRERQDDLAWLERLTSPYTAADVVRLLGLERRYGTRGALEGMTVGPAPRAAGISADGILHRLRNDRDALTRQLDRAQLEAMRSQGAEPVGWERLNETVGKAAHIALYHVLGRDRVLLFTSGTGGEPRVVTVTADLHEIDAVLVAARRGSGFDFREVDLERLQRAAGPLVAPLAGLPPDELVAVIPHGPLHSIPLHVLDVAGVPMGLRNPVCHAPSASLLVRRLSTCVPQASGEPVVVGDPAGDLAHARMEAVTVAEQLGVSPVLGDAVSKRLVTDTLFRTEAPPGLVHVAAHGTLETHDGSAGIVLGRPWDAGGREHRVLSAADLRGARLPAALVVLSCCTSGINTLRPGDELTGLVRSFLTAGAASVIVSQWSVDDLSTSLLMRAFYARLRGTAAEGAAASIAHALRDAVIEVRSLTRQRLAELTAPHSAEGPSASEPATARALRIDSVALSAPDDFAMARAALAASSDTALRDAALEAEERHAALAALQQSDEDARFPFRHPHYWAPFVLVGDWRAPGRAPRPGPGTTTPEDSA
ncbi:CHAT domain-containing protein [Streptomyces sp. R39]|uniref:CHAT domain-containing protein n=1 Tax=Streptomyces sp. R39 TaxID=3238631 RepID=A0AB39R915_9ACTN